MFPIRFCILLGIASFFNCVAVNPTKDLKAHMAQVRFLVFLKNLNVVHPPPLLNSDGTPLHPAIEDISPTTPESRYTLSSPENVELAELHDQLEKQGLLTSDSIQKNILHFENLVSTKSRTPEEVIEDADDADLGIPPKDRTLTEEEKKKAIENERIQFNAFQAELRSYIYEAKLEELKTLRSNLNYSIYLYSFLEEELKNHSQETQDFFKDSIYLTAQTRMLVIDAILAKK